MKGNESRRCHYYSINLAGKDIKNPPGNAPDGQCLFSAGERPLKTGTDIIIAQTPGGWKEPPGAASHCDGERYESRRTFIIAKNRFHVSATSHPRR